MSKTQAFNEGAILGFLMANAIGAPLLTLVCFLEGAWLGAIMFGIAALLSCYIWWRDYRFAFRVRR